MNNPLRKKIKGLGLGEQFELAFKEAVAKEIEDHRLKGDPIVVFRNNEVVWIQPERTLPLLPGKSRAKKIAPFRLSMTKRRRPRARTKRIKENMFGTVHRLSARF
jgi:hypothetical protein